MNLKIKTLFMYKQLDLFENDAGSKTWLSNYLRIRRKEAKYYFFIKKVKSWNNNTLPKQKKSRINKIQRQILNNL